MKKLESQVEQKNKDGKPVTEGEVDAIEAGLQTVIKAFGSLAQFKSKNCNKVPRLMGLPIDEGKVAELQDGMPANCI